MNVVLKNFKLANGGVDYAKVLSISFEDRLQGLTTKMGYESVHKLICVAIQLAMESLNLSQTLTAAQIIELGDVILESSIEDFLALEDVVLFLQKLIRGEAGTLFSRIDIPTFMERFEKYRQERHTTFKAFREEQIAQHKSLGLDTSGKTLRMDKNMDAKTFIELWQMQNEEKSDK